MRVLLFARLREAFGVPERALEFPDGARAGDVWAALLRERPALQALSVSIRIARNGRLVAASEPLGDGDEVALLPPSGGG